MNKIWEVRVSTSKNIEWLDMELPISVMFLVSKIFCRKSNCFRWVYCFIVVLSFIFQFIYFSPEIYFKGTLPHWLLSFLLIAAFHTLWQTFNPVRSWFLLFYQIIINLPSKYAMGSLYLPLHFRNIRAAFNHFYLIFSQYNSTSFLNSIPLSF